MAYQPHKIVREKTSKIENQKKFWQIFLIEGGLFLITSLLSVVAAFQLNKLVKIKQIYLPTNSLQDFLFSILFVTFFVVLLVSFKKAGKLKMLIYKGLFIIAVFWGGMTVLNLLMPIFVAILVMGILIYFWLEFPTVWIQDILMVLGLAGAGSFFGLGFSPEAVVALLLIFSIYDFIAVYKTKHMVMMAKEMVDKKVILGFIIPKEFNLFKSSLKDIKQGGNFLILGGGDVVFPSLMAASVIPSGLLKSLVIVLFALGGSLFSFYIFMKEKEPIPALPPIALFSILGYFVTLLF